MDIDRCWVFYSESGSLGITTGCKRFARKDCLAVWRWRLGVRHLKGLSCDIALITILTDTKGSWLKGDFFKWHGIAEHDGRVDLRPFAQAYKGSGRQERLYYVTIKTASFKKAWSGRSSHWMINSDTWLRKQTRTWPPIYADVLLSCENEIRKAQKGIWNTSLEARMPFGAMLCVSS